VDILLVSGRGAGGEPHPSVALAERLAGELTARGDAVRHLRSRSGVPVPKGIQARLGDPELEIALTKALRGVPPPLVHVLAFGGTSSTQTAWIAARLGATTVVSLDAKVAACERGTLIHASGAPCSIVDDAARCVACCGLPRRALVELENRFELVLGGLQPANLVLVATEEERSLLLGLGLAGRQVRVIGGLTALDSRGSLDALLGAYASFR
jgi:hypothetical protein